VPKHKGISFFMFPMRQAGVEIRPIHQITGESEFNEVFISNAGCRTPTWSAVPERAGRCCNSRSPTSAG
jgi:alkylation response protein AidB-like acyl-CoA dehydrogenase